MLNAGGKSAIEKARPGAIKVGLVYLVPAPAPNFLAALATQFPRNSAESTGEFRIAFAVLAQLSWPRTLCRYWPGVIPRSRLNT
ncbi:hypothetical protein RB6546 [Rhodopirellula baltica SH 1]|uniref:Uncharacterized protein n=1 Tax=Rhodopirellula baltica (strain DSM 10527 / NCIMB 13988 / SH1) TaxID=243090 RepID=Q7UQ34_RHOBA|nr:hypothetical protein RB6546 [Rhodopirellula baltica SH 1]